MSLKKLGIGDTHGFRRSCHLQSWICLVNTGEKEPNAIDFVMVANQRNELVKFVVTDVTFRSNASQNFDREKSEKVT